MAAIPIVSELYPGSFRGGRSRPVPTLRTDGFTIVELIVVIILLGILSVVAFGRFLGAAAFTPGIVVHAVVTEGRFAQQLAASRADARVTLILDRQGGEWRFQTITDVDGVVRTERISADDTIIVVSSGPANSAIDTVTPLVIGFSTAGDLQSVVVGASAGSAALGVDLMVQGASNRAACLHPSGYASDAACS